VHHHRKKVIYDFDLGEERDSDSVDDVQQEEVIRQRDQ
jgi:hypothetical protein